MNRKSPGSVCVCPCRNQSCKHKTLCTTSSWLPAATHLASTPSTPLFPQPRSPSPAGAPAAAPAAPRAVAEGAASPGSRTEPGGDLGSGGRTRSPWRSPPRSSSGPSLGAGGFQPLSGPVWVTGRRPALSVSPAGAGPEAAAGAGGSSRSPPGAPGQVNAPGPAPRLGWASGGWGSQGASGTPRSLQGLRAQRCGDMSMG